MNAALKFLTGIGFALPVVGVAGGTYFAISKIAQIKSSNDPLATLASAGSSNCIIIDSFKKNLESENIKKEDYYPIFCRNMRMDSDFYIPSILQGAFPKSIFKNQNLSNGKILDIKVNITDIEQDKDKVTFYSSQFNNGFELKGNLNYKVFREGENTIQGGIVTFDSPVKDQKIYLDWEEYRYII